MKFFKGSSLACIGLLVVSSLGCQSGKLAMPDLSMPDLSMPKITMPDVSMPKVAMPKLAFWKNDSDKFNDDYIEPPSYQFSPSGEAAGADNNASESPSRLAENMRSKSKPYDTTRGSGDSFDSSSPSRNRSLESFEQDLTKAYERLASSSESSVDQATGKASQQLSRTMNQGAKQLNQFAGNSQTPTRSGAGDFSGGLQPKFGAARNSNSPAASSGSSRNKGGQFSPSATTQYEQIAASQSTGEPPSHSPLTPRSSGNMFNRSPNHVQNPHFQKQNSTASAIPSDVDQSQSQTVGYDQYPSTPHKPFEPREQENLPDAAPAESLPTTKSLAPKNQTPQNLTPKSQAPPMPSAGFGKQPAALPSQLLKGQGTYAPGSVKAPTPMSPEQVAAPQDSGQSTGYGGSFQPN